MKFQGTVQQGSGYAAELGFRTVNIPLTEESLEGIFAARVTIKEGEAPYMAAAFANQRRKILEAHILDFSDTLSGVTVTIELMQKIREAKTFDTEAQLKAAIAGDVEKVRAFFQKS